ncbi:hypothetical protein CMV30_05150 [Nibricoccus aquaticus]|uniref:EF-hand domain-containing protein n=1 Tax=Nibricoccus aquaticus TaxID=2576891 RepID=A0A290QFI1_9BACT|nr:hypothetical protein [Nibricoccus aquaticus]ATC66000.1 hypothetical protein CMV30_05150 [Nibricoccus aquaticus]
MTTTHRWKFFRSGGLDQVLLQSGADLLNLEHLDQKLWVALSCPVKGLELDEKTLSLIDLDGDGRIRVPEVISAIKWTALHLKNLDDVLAPQSALPLDLINDQTPEGKSVLASAKQVLANLGKAGATSISVADTTDTKKIFSETTFNGDGIIPAEAASTPELKQLIGDIIASYGADTDRSGKPGITQAKLDQFYTEIAAYADWAGKGSAKEILSAGEVATTAYDTIKTVRAKIDDFFARCRLAAFDSRALAALNRQESEYLAIAAKDLKITNEEVSGFPLSRVEPNKALPLTEGVNPAWAGALAVLQKAVVAPLFGANKTSLTADEWTILTGKLAPYETWLASKPATPVEKLGLPRIQAIHAAKEKPLLDALIAEDKALEPQALAITAVDRLARYYRDLRTLLHNFVNFSDFYDPRYPATFQIGTLYVDSRSCDLCIRVDDPAAHAGLASLSKVYIAYCDLKRPGGETMKIAACVTQGDSDYLMVGRNGLFYDRKGRDWDAHITKIIDNPISIRQAFLSPYKKFIRMIEEQVAKRAAAADSAADAKLAAAAAATANADKNAPAAPAAAPVPAKKIDVGTVAALGVAFGAIMGAIGAIATGLAGLAIWQLPLVFIGLILVISGPSMIIAWLKLRQRTLGPILDANGWAVNGRVKVNVPLGTELTARAVIPEGSTRSLEDPFEDKAAKRRKRLTILTLLLLVTVWLGYNLWAAPHYGLEKRLWPFEKKAVPVVPVVAPEAAVASAAPAPVPAK